MGLSTHACVAVFRPSSSRPPRLTPPKPLSNVVLPPVFPSRSVCIPALFSIVLIPILCLSRPTQCTRRISSTASAVTHLFLPTGRVWHRRRSPSCHDSPMPSPTTSTSSPCYSHSSAHLSAAYSRLPNDLQPRLPRCPLPIAHLSLSVSRPQQAPEVVYSTTDCAPPLNPLRRLLYVICRLRSAARPSQTYVHNSYVHFADQSVLDPRCALRSTSYHTDIISTDRTSTRT